MPLASWITLQTPLACRHQHLDTYVQSGSELYSPSHGFGWVSCQHTVTHPLWAPVCEVWVSLGAEASSPHTPPAHQQHWGHNLNWDLDMLLRYNPGEQGVPGLCGALGKVAGWLFVSRNLFVFQVLLLWQWPAVNATQGDSEVKRVLEILVHTQNPSKCPSPKNGSCFPPKKGRWKLPTPRPWKKKRDVFLLMCQKAKLYPSSPSQEGCYW